MTMRVSKAMPKGKSKATAAPKTTRKRSKALPFVEAPEGLKESQDGCMSALFSSRLGQEGMRMGTIGGMGEDVCGDGIKGRGG